MTKSHQADKAGIACSGLCAIHCALGPIIAFSSPGIVRFFDNEWIHIGLLVLIVPIAIFAFVKGHNVHNNIKPFALGFIGLVFLLSAVIFEALHIEIEFLEISLTVVGCVLLTIAHFLNIKYQRLT
tara:strand:+ start:10685 stop:11062 length:378 start_codon:yes stop_codon:yes gene_type:complete